MAKVIEDVMEPMGDTVDSALCAKLASVWEGLFDKCYPDVRNCPENRWRGEDPLLVQLSTRLFTSYFHHGNSSLSFHISLVPDLDVTVTISANQSYPQEPDVRLSLPRARSCGRRIKFQTPSRFLHWFTNESPLDELELSTFFFSGLWAYGYLPGYGYFTGCFVVSLWVSAFALTFGLRTLIFFYPSSGVVFFTGCIAITDAVIAVWTCGIHVMVFGACVMILAPFVSIGGFICQRLVRAAVGPSLFGQGIFINPANGNMPDMYWCMYMYKVVLWNPILAPIGRVLEVVFCCWRYYLAVL
ncbi:hypothetical protein QBC39DRAFT_337824 [Podospora conica]|nr:hypothetical protein QBC39DRAFT_337824 [Schizothecium conicum]